LICDDQKDFTQRKAAKKAAKETLSAFRFLPPAYCLLPPAHFLLSERNAVASSSTFAISGTFAFTVANAAA
jgi:hypothetical protein